jgi:putative ABC transport system permease protein
VRLVQRVPSWIRANLRRARMEREMDREMRFHLEARAEDLMRSGMPRAEAMRRARIEFGGMEGVKEECRETRGVGFAESISRDVRFGLRMLRKSPGFTVTAVLTLALGIAANSTVFSVINAGLLHSLPFRNASRLVDVSARSTIFDFPNLGLSWPDIGDVRTGARSLQGLATYRTANRELAGYGQAERIESAEVSAEVLPMLGIQPLYGRAFTSPDMEQGSLAVMVGYSLWRERLGGDPNAVGKTLLVDGQARAIIGVLPRMPELGFITDFQLWTPLIPSVEDRAARNNHGFSVLAMLRPGATLEQAQSELAVIAARLAREYPDADKGWSLRAASLKNYLLGDATAPLAILFCAVSFILLIACANVSNLFVTRGWGRRREFAIRAAIGASRRALLRQLSIECLLVALLGGLCALLAELWTVHGLRRVLPAEIPRLDELKFDSQVVWFTLGASLLAALVAALAPVLLAFREDVNTILKEGEARTRSTAGHDLFRQSLVVGEIALALVLVIGATLAVRSFAKILAVNPGFRSDHLILMHMDFPHFRFSTAEKAIGFVQQILDRSRSLTGVESASASLVYPLGDAVGETTFETEESVKDPQAGPQSALGNRVAPDFFRTFGIPLLAGRDFRPADTKTSAPVYIVNRTLARKSFGSENVVGKRLSTRRDSGHPVWGEIVGVAGDVRQLDPGAEPKAEVYAAFYQTALPTGVYLVARTRPDPTTVVTAIEDRIWSIAKDQPITDIKTASARIAEVNATPRSQSVLLSIFAALGLVLALIGVYGVISYFVSQQTREIGIRMALGADRSTILRSVLAHGLRLTFLGVAIGTTGSLALTRFLGSLLFGISPTDPLTFIGVAVILSAIAMSACYVPARRAMRVDPLVALRCE